MKRMAIALMVAAAVALTSAQANRGMSQDEIDSGVLAAGAVVQIDSGKVLDEIRVSADGSWIAVTAFSTDIKNNDLWLISGDGKSRKKLDAPYGYKNTPVFWSGPSRTGAKKPLKLFVSLAGNGKGGLADGIYSCSLADAKPRWTLWEKGDFRDLALSPSEEFLMATSGKWNAATVRSVARVWRLDSEARKLGASYAVAQGLKGQVHKIAMSPDDAKIYFECTVDSPGSYYGVSNIYAAPNSEGSAAELLLEDASQPEIRPLGSGYRLLYKRGAGIEAYDPGTGEVASLVELAGLYPNGLAFDRAKGRILLGAQIDGSIAGLLAIESE